MKKRFILFCLIVFLILLLFDSEYYISNILDYSKLFLTNLFPFVLLIFTISSMLIDFGLLELLPPTLYVLCLSMVSGFPSSAKYVAELQKDGYLKKRDAECLIRSCHYPNPLFVLGSVSSVIPKKSCFLLLMILYLSSFLEILIHGGISIRKSRIQKENIPFLNSFLNSLTKAFQTILLIYGTSVFSFCIANLAIRMFHLHGILYSFVYGLFDLTKGIFSTVIFHQKRIREMLILLFLSFGSISIHLQVAGILRDSDGLYLKYFKGRVTSTILVFILYFLFYAL